MERTVAMGTQLEEVGGSGKVTHVHDVDIPRIRAQHLMMEAGAAHVVQLGHGPLPLRKTSDAHMQQTIRRIGVDLGHGRMLCTGQLC